MLWILFIVIIPSLFLINIYKPFFLIEPNGVV